MNFKKTEMCGFKYPHARKKQDLYHLFFMKMEISKSSVFTSQFMVILNQLHS